MISNKQRTLYSIIIVMVIAILGILTYQTISSSNQIDFDEERAEDLGSSDGAQVQGEEETIIDDSFGNELIRDLRASAFDHFARLLDVTNGETIRGVMTGGVATGLAQQSFTSTKRYQLLAEFDELPDPTGDDFYEGWVVRQEPFAFISTGRVEKEGDVYVNGFESDEDYSEYTQYVLTLEPNDGDPAPADHILEGTFQAILDVK